MPINCGPVKLRFMHTGEQYAAFKKEWGGAFVLLEILKAYNVKETSCRETCKQDPCVCKKDAHELVYDYNVSEGIFRTVQSGKMAGPGVEVGVFFTFHYFVQL